MTQRAIDGDYIYFVTTLVKNREWYFVNPERAWRLVQIIRNACVMKRFHFLAYCILPNHVHLLVRKTAVTVDQTQRALEKARCEMGSHSTLATVQSGLSSPRRREYTLSQLMQSIKGNYSWQTIDGGLWHPRFNFRIVETEERLNNTINYIVDNYKKMDLDDRFGKPPFVFIDHDRIVGLLR
jgi:REP element-mobilizing transposase RayT